MEDREKMIEEKIKEEDFLDMMQLRGVKLIVWEKLTKEKGFNPKEIENDPQIEIALSDCKVTVSIDFIINLSSTSFSVIKCTNSGLESWERYLTAFARAAKDYQIPYAMVTNGDEARIIDIIAGTKIGDSMQEFFTLEEALNVMKKFKKIPCPINRLEKEKRIIYAFEGIKCPTTNPPNS
jgi:hypothetical protein